MMAHTLAHYTCKTHTHSRYSIVISTQILHTFTQRDAQRERTISNRFPQSLIILYEGYTSKKDNKKAGLHSQKKAIPCRRRTIRFVCTMTYTRYDECSPRSADGRPAAAHHVNIAHVNIQFLIQNTRIMAWQNGLRYFLVVAAPCITGI